MDRIIVEIKARASNHAELRERLLQAGARLVGEDHQVDTYFQVPNGRLKLREGTIENHLIQYQRPNQEAPKLSTVRLYQSADPTALKGILTAAMDVLVVVDKKREIYFIDNVKFHLDYLENLGTFVEIEAIGTTQTHTEAELRAQCDHFLAFLGIEASHLIDRSYSDLLIDLLKN